MLAFWTSTESHCGAFSAVRSVVVFVFSDLVDDGRVHRKMVGLAEAMMTLDEVALQLFAAFIARKDSAVSIHNGHLGEQQVRTCFELAKTFLKVSRDMHDDGVVKVTNLTASRLTDRVDASIGRSEEKET